MKTIHQINDEYGMLVYHILRELGPYEDRHFISNSKLDKFMKLRLLNIGIVYDNHLTVRQIELINHLKHELTLANFNELLHPTTGYYDMFKPKLYEREVARFEENLRRWFVKNYAAEMLLVELK